jgi:hydroxymethylglutaryl-CoA reductase
MVIEESSVVAAASNAAKFWFDKGGFKAEVVDTVKIGQVHFIWNGRKELLQKEFAELKAQLILNTKDITKNMENRGGGILDVELVDMNDKEPGYFQLKCSFETVDSMGANFVNSCLEEFASTLEFWIENNELFTPEEKKVDVIMSILSNYTPDCLVRVWVECPVEDLGVVNGMPAEEFAWKFEKAI